MLSPPGRQLLNWARKAALMNEDEFTTEYSSFSATARKQIGLLYVEIFPFELVCQMLSRTCLKKYLVPNMPKYL